MLKFEDIMFDSDPIELAEELTSLSDPIEVVIITDEEADLGDDIYFGLPTEIGEIIEVKAVVKSIKVVGEDIYEISIVAKEVDKDMEQLAINTLNGNVKKSEDGEPIWALGLKQQNNTYAVLANSPGGILTSEQLLMISKISKEGAGIVKLTHAQRVVILTSVDLLEQTTQDLESVGLRVGVLHHGIRNVRACCGALCRFCQQTDGIPLAREIDDRFFGRGTAFDVKIAISDCMRNCSESYCADIGLIADKGTYEIVIGGRGSQIPFRALRLVEGIAPEKATDVVEEIVDWYTSHAEKGERLHKLLLRLGSDNQIDLSRLESALVEVGDGVDEVGRLKEQVSRMSGLKKMQQELSFCK